MSLKLSPLVPSPEVDVTRLSIYGNLLIDTTFRPSYNSRQAPESCSFHFKFPVLTGPQHRAIHALWDHLDEKQREDFSNKFCFFVEGKTYIWKLNYSGNAQAFRRKKRSVLPWKKEYVAEKRPEFHTCVFSSTNNYYYGRLPRADELLTFKLMIEANESYFERVGNKVYMR